MTTLVFWLGLATIVFTYMTLWFGISLWTKRYDVVDSAWGLGFVLVAWVSVSLSGNNSVIQIISALLVSIWGIRLSAHIANRNLRKSEDDHRYQTMSAKWGKNRNQKAYTNVFLLQGFLLTLISLPMIAIAQSSATAVNPGVICGWVIWVAGIIIEAIADRQLGNFITKRPAGSHAIMNRGLWRYSRHPNYFGEVTVWWGAAIVAVSVGGWWGIAGAIAISILIVKISGIPPLEKHYEGNAEYAKYAKKTSVLIPLPVKNV